jgi:hypothetical protein
VIAGREMGGSSSGAPVKGSAYGRDRVLRDGVGHLASTSQSLFYKECETLDILYATITTLFACAVVHCSRVTDKECPSVGYL